MVNQNYSFDYFRIPYNSNAHLLSIPHGKPPHFDGEDYSFRVIKCVVIYFPSILVRCEHEGLSLSPKDLFVITPYLYSYQVQPLQTVWAAA
jgi:hypothetical protein